jgi:transcriptional regulator with XRE-family HTH domain
MKTEQFTCQVRERLKSTRKEMGLTLGDLTAGTGYSIATFSSVETGRTAPGQRLLDAWIRRLGLTDQWLLDGTGDRFKQEPAFWIIPVHQLKEARERLAKIQDAADIMAEEADRLELVIRHSEEIHKSEGGDASEKWAFTTHPDGTDEVKQIG